MPQKILRWIFQAFFFPFHFVLPFHSQLFSRIKWLIECRPHNVYRQTIKRSIMTFLALVLRLNENPLIVNRGKICQILMNKMIGKRWRNEYEKPKGKTTATEQRGAMHWWLVCWCQTLKSFYFTTLKSLLFINNFMRSLMSNENTKILFRKLVKMLQLKLALLTRLLISFNFFFFSGRFVFVFPSH